MANKLVHEVLLQSPEKHGDSAVKKKMTVILYRLIINPLSPWNVQETQRRQENINLRNVRDGQAESS